MATVLRVKRRNDEDPLDALIIAGKRRKTEAGASNDTASKIPLTAVLKFAGTLNSQEADVVEHIHKTFSKDELKANYKQHVVDVANKARLNTQAESKANRYKVVNYNRSINSSKTEDEDEKIVTVIDVEDSGSSAVDTVPDSEKSFRWSLGCISFFLFGEKSRSTECFKMMCYYSVGNKNCKALFVAPIDLWGEKREVLTASDNSTEIGYVYDVYYTQTEEDMHLDDDLSIHPFEQELVLDPYRENGVPEEDPESDDSNSESNWRNDYPDSDHSSNSVDDDDMREAVRKMKIDGESSDLSSDHEDFVYAVDEGDVEAFGYNYAKYKARVKDEIDDDEDSDESKQSLDSEPSDDDGDEKTEED